MAAPWQLSAALFSHGAEVNRHCLVSGVMPPERPVGQGSHMKTIKYCRKLIPLAHVCILELCDSELASFWGRDLKVLLKVYTSACPEPLASSQG